MIAGWELGQHVLCEPECSYLGPFATSAPRDVAGQNMILRLATRLEQNMLHQRAKIAWMKGGDQCSRVFFRKVAKRRSSKRVFQITDSGGQVLTEQQDVVREFIAFYQNLLGGERRNRMLDLCYLRPWARHILSEAEALTLYSQSLRVRSSMRCLISMRSRLRAGRLLVGLL
ncbi:UNVERIFIED_CONTAM: hypothetical protein Slati_2946800 [Sesamum latifolium]|uniref:Uncharacterized protein n=1 Tax=Sesamum latifolium TaxID=2727402 RepID=A0AAW2VDR9_9LAMI